MPNTASAAKQARASLRRRERNRAAMSAVRSALKRFRAAVAAGKKDEAKSLLPKVVSLLDKAVKRGLLHRNAANRHKSRFAALLRSPA